MPATRLLLLAGRNVSDPVGEGSVLRPLVEAAQLDHVVDQADHGQSLGTLLLQLLQMVAQIVHHSLVMFKAGVVAIACGTFIINLCSFGHSIREVYSLTVVRTAATKHQESDFAFASIAAQSLFHMAKLGLGAFDSLRQSGGLSPQMNQH